MKFARINRLARPLLFGFGFLFLAVMAVSSWPELRLLLKDIRWPFFLLAMFVAILGNVLTSFLMRELFDTYGVRISSSLGHKVYFYAQIAKYIPGKVWSFWYQATLLSTTSSISAMLFVNLDLTITLIILTASLASALILIKYSIFLTLIAFFFGLFLNLWFLNNSYFVLFAHRMFSNIKFFSDTLCNCQRRLSSFKFISFYILFSLTYLISHLLMFYAAFGFSFSKSIEYTTYMTLSWIAGVLSFVVPGGVGVKEFVFIMLVKAFSGDISVEAVAAMAIISRFAIMLQELMGVVLAFLLGSSD